MLVRLLQWLIRCGVWCLSILMTRFLGCFWWLRLTTSVSVWLLRSIRCTAVGVRNRLLLLLLWCRKLKLLWPVSMIFVTRLSPCVILQLLWWPISSRLLWITVVRCPVSVLILSVCSRFSVLVTCLVATSLVVLLSRSRTILWSGTGLVQCVVLCLVQGLWSVALFVSFRLWVGLVGLAVWELRFLIWSFWLVLLISMLGNYGGGPDCECCRLVFLGLEVPLLLLDLLVGSDFEVVLCLLWVDMFEFPLLRFPWLLPATVNFEAVWWVMYLLRHWDGRLLVGLVGALLPIGR